MKTIETTQKNTAWRWAGNLLIICIIVCNGYTILAPLWPTLYWQMIKSTPLPTTMAIGKSSELKAIDISRNHLIIPELRVDAPIGSSVGALNDGAWLRP